MWESVDESCAAFKLGGPCRAIEFPKIMSKRAWFLMFNLGTIAYLMIDGTLRWETVSVISCGIALLLINGIAWISARKFKEWK